MTVEELRHLIASGENRTLELKKSTGELKDGMHSACAFMNADGGVLVFGVTPVSLKMCGQPVTDATRQEIAAALTGFEPPIDVKVEYLNAPEGKQGEKLIIMQFDGWVWGKHPCTYRGCPYYKPESVTKIMPQSMYDERLRASFPHKYAWEEQDADGISAKDLSEERIMEAVRLGVAAGRINVTAIGESIDTLLGKLNLKTDDGKLKNAAVVLFAKDTDRYPQLMLRLARFDGTDKHSFSDSQRIRGNFFDLLDAGMAFAFKHLNVRGRIIGLQREDRLEIPMEAMREALINAFCHRSYDNAAASVSMAIYDDRVEIENPGHLPNALTPETMLLPHDSYPANIDIAEILFKTKYLDSWGSGVERMIAACRNHGIDAPVYHLRPGGIAIVFQRPAADKFHDTQCAQNDTQRVQNATRRDQNDTERVQNDTQSLPNDTQNKRRNQTETRRKQLAEYIDGNRHVSTAELAVLLKISVSTVKRDLTVLGYRWVGSPKTGYWSKV